MSARFKLRLNVTNCSNVTLVTLSRLESSSQVTRTRLGRDSTALSDWLSWRLVVGITGYTVNLYRECHTCYKLTTLLTSSPTR